MEKYVNLRYESKWTVQGENKWKRIEQTLITDNFFIRNDKHQTERGSRWDNFAFLSTLGAQVGCDIALSPKTFFVRRRRQSKVDSRVCWFLNLRVPTSCESLFIYRNVSVRSSTARRRLAGLIINKRVRFVVAISITRRQTSPFADIFLARFTQWRANIPENR